MNIEVIEFELTCEKHGKHRLLVPVELPRPGYARTASSPPGGGRSGGL
ncbi:MAG: hypothetical protein M5U18_06275 [Dehalococcoidia bacterium]|nr:hypothetical protein [Dehalococcoidia bacterium]